MNNSNKLENNSKDSTKVVNHTILEHPELT